MPSTTITPAVGSRPRRGFRMESNPVFTKARYDVFQSRGGRDEYVRSETRTFGINHADEVPVDLAVVRHPDGREFVFDSGMLPPTEGEPVQLIEHRVAFLSVVDLHHDAYGIVTAKALDPISQPGRAASVVFGLATGAALMHFRSWSFDHATMATIGAGLGLHALRWARYHYVLRTLALLRWRADRRLARARI